MKTRVVVLGAGFGGLEPARRVAEPSDGTELPYALFLGIPVHRVPQVVVESGLAAHPHDWVPVNKQTLETKFPGVYAVGDVNGVGTPKAGVFAEGSAQVVAAAIISQLRRGPAPDAYKGRGSCYVEFGPARRGEDTLRPQPSSAMVRPPAGHAAISSSACRGPDLQLGECDKPTCG